MAPVERAERSAAHKLLLGLGTELAGPGAVLRHDASGRPWVEHPATDHRPAGRLWASVSHGRGVVAVAATCGGPVGVDVEDVDSRRSFGTTGLAHRWFDPAELAWLADHSDPLEAFLRLWTAKEAVGKALGAGLRGQGLRRRMPLDNGHVPGAEPALTVLQLPVTAGAVVAVAVFAGAREVQLTEWAGSAGHGAARRSAAASRSSFPVVVLGN
jgi:phosphopantetheinyl transferase